MAIGSCPHHTTRVDWAPCQSVWVKELIVATSLETEAESHAHESCPKLNSAWTSEVPGIIPGYR